MRDVRRPARSWLALWRLTLGAILAAGSDADARSLTDIFRNPTLVGLRLSPIGPALAGSVASSYPVASASSSVSYTFDPETGTFERRAGVPGPVIGERAETIGLHQVSVEMSYSYVSLTSVNGDDLDELENKPRIGNSVVSLRYPPTRRLSAVTLADGRLTSFLPVRVLLDLDVTAHILTPGITYGITPDLDVNLTVPVIDTSLRVLTRTRVPDPRLPQFTLCPSARCPGNARVDPTQGTISLSDSAVGLGDVLVRA